MCDWEPLLGFNPSWRQTPAHEKLLAIASCIESLVCLIVGRYIVQIYKKSTNFIFIVRPVRFELTLLSF